MHIWITFSTGKKFISPHVSRHRFWQGTLLNTTEHFYQFLSICHCIPLLLAPSIILKKVQIKFTFSQEKILIEFRINRIS